MAKVLRANGMKRCLGCFTCMLTCAIVNRKNHSISDSAIKVKTFGGLSGEFVANVCFACAGERACMEACPSGALTKRAGGGVILDKAKCIGCRKCADACIVNAVFFNDDEISPIICRHCGVCAQYCPHQCLSMEECENDL